MVKYEQRMQTLNLLLENLNQRSHQNDLSVLNGANKYRHKHYSCGDCHLLECANNFSISLDFVCFFSRGAPACLGKQEAVN